MKTINTEIALIILVGLLLTVIGIAMNFQNLALAQTKFEDPKYPGVLNNNEIVYNLLQVVGMAIMFIGATRGLMRRADLMSNKFVNIMDVFSGLIKKEIEVIDDQKRKKSLAEIDERGDRFRKEMKSLRRL